VVNWSLKGSQPAKISLPAMTEKRHCWCYFAIEQKVDWLALSFVKTPQDLKDLQNLIAEHSDYKIPIIKIEMPKH
jgi:pyruvate kinase